MRLQTSLLVVKVLSILMIILFPKKEDKEMKRSKFYQKERKNTYKHHAVVMDKAKELIQQKFVKDIDMYVYDKFHDKGVIYS